MNLIAAVLSAVLLSLTGSPDTYQSADLRSGGNLLPTKVYAEAEDAKLMALFKDFCVADIADGMDAVSLQNVGLMNPAIDALWRDTKSFTHRFVGIAVTARYVPTQKPPAGSRSVEAYDARAGEWYDKLSTEAFATILRPGTALVPEDAPDADLGSIGTFNMKTEDQRRPFGIIKGRLRP